MIIGKRATGERIELPATGVGNQFAALAWPADGSAATAFQNGSEEVIAHLSCRRNMGAV